MKRVRFIRSTATYAKKSMITLSDGDADRAIAAGDAVEGDPIVVAGGEQPKAVPTKRVIFLKPFKYGEGDNAKQWPKDSRGFLPDVIADAAVKSGHAKLFPIASVGGEETVKPAKREKALA